MQLLLHAYILVTVFLLCLLLAKLSAVWKLREAEGKPNIICETAVQRQFLLISTRLICFLVPGEAAPVTVVNVGDCL